MKKTVGTLCAGDHIFSPRIHTIDEIRVTQIIKDKHGTRIDSDDFSARIRDCDYCAEIATKVTYKENQRTYYVRLEDAQKKQKELQTTELHRLQISVNTAIQKLNEFTNQYFTDGNSKANNTLP